LIQDESRRGLSLKFKYSGMNSTDRQWYEAPSVKVIGVAQGGVICASKTVTIESPDFNPFNNEEEW